MAKREDYVKVQLQALAQQVVGFDCVFVDPPHDMIQTECPVCLQFIQEPHQVTCCGNIFCGACIERIKRSKKVCPTCNQRNFTDFPDKRLKRSLLGLKVYCNHQKDGCEWTGELGELDQHLNTNPKPGKQLNGCPLVQVSCTLNCGETMTRRSIKTHQSDNCPKRPFSCEHCKVYKATYEDVSHNHWPMCGSFPVQCPNDCGSTLQRQNIGDHLNKECKLETIKCDLHYVGCTDVVPRKDMAIHLRENLLTHISLLAASQAKQQIRMTILLEEKNELKSENEKLQQKYQELKDKNADLEATLTRQQAQIDSLTKGLSSNTSRLNSKLATLSQELEVVSKYTTITRPVVTMENFQRHKGTKKIWQSPPIYTHYHGYKICLRVDANGSKGKYVEVFVNLMKGEFDDTLQWPFHEKITVQLIDQTSHEIGSKGVLTVQFDDSAFPECCSRVKVGLVAGQGLGTNKFIAHSELEPKYLKDDKLLFLVSKAIY